MAKKDAWKSALERGETVEFAPSRWRLAFLLLLALMFVLIGAAMLVGGAVLVGLICILFFGVLGVPVLILRMIKVEPELQVANEGIRTRQSADRLIPWAEVDGVYEHEFKDTTLLAIRINQATYDALPRTSGWWGSLAKLNSHVMGGPALAIPGGIGAKRADLIVWLDEELIRRNPAAKHRQGASVSSKEMRDLDAQILRNGDELQ